MTNENLLGPKTIYSANLSSILEEHKDKIKMLIYGAEQTKKTWWTGLLTSCNYNVIYLDCDDGLRILQNLPIEDQRKISVLSISDFPDQPVAYDFISNLKQKSFSWNNTQRKLYSKKNSEEGDEIITFDRTALSKNDVIVLDSYTALVDSAILSYGIKHDADMDDAELYNWDYYYAQQQALNHKLRILLSLPCHVIVIAHQTISDVTKTVGDKVKKVGEEISIASSSRNHAKSIGRYFSDIMYFYLDNFNKVFITNEREKNRLSGSKIVSAFSAPWKDVPPEKFFKMLPEFKATPAIIIKQENKENEQNEQSENKENKETKPPAKPTFSFPKR